MSIYQFSATTVKGEQELLSKYKGKVLLIVNTAGKCGFTAQYHALQQIDEPYGKAYFSVWAFSGNQLLRQGPGSNEDEPTPGLPGNFIEWNFTKSLVDDQGNVQNRYAPITSPSKLSGEIEALLVQVQEYGQ